MSDTPEIRSKTRLLFVDDEAHARSSFLRVIGREGYDVHVAESGDQALAMASETFFPVILTDMRMPGIDGISLIRRLQPLQPSTAFVVVTGLPNLDLKRDHAIDPSIVGILPKPWEREEMLGVIQRALDIHTKRYASFNQVLDERPAGPPLLLVDGHDEAKAQVQALLEAQSGVLYPLEHVRRISDALERVHDTSFPLILADLSLPDARGLDAVRRLQTAAPASALVIYSGHDDEDLALHAIQLGAQDYLVKGSTTASDLRRALRHALERKRAEARLSNLAHFDQLTGLANRSTFRDRLGHAFARCRRRRARFAVLFIDLDEFKAVNDRLGHDAGDALLQEVATRLRSAAREGDTVARLGGDEFALVLEGLHSPHDAHVVSQRLLTKLAEPIHVHGSELRVTASVGAAIFPDAGDNPEALLRAADAAMYDAKAAGRNTYRVNDGEDMGGELPRRRLEVDLQLAVEQQRLQVHYQPQVSLATGNVCGFEALLRWEHPKLGPVSPGVFVPLLEQMGLMFHVGAWVLKQACGEMARWRAAGLDQLRVAVNLSAAEFEVPSLVDTVREAIRAAEIPPECLELEISEAMLMRNTETTNNNLLGLRELGARVTIDHYGTGYSSVTFLDRFKITALKFDRSLVPTLTPDVHASSIASAIIELGKKLGIEVIAEGVESEEHLSLLRRDGCDIAQGHVLARAALDWDPATYATWARQFKGPPTPLPSPWPDNERTAERVKRRRGEGS